MAKPKATVKRKKKIPATVFPEGTLEMLQGEALKPLTIETFLDVGTQARLIAFCAAHHGADPRVVIHKAVEDFIQHDLETNEGVQSEYKGKDL